MNQQLVRAGRAALRRTSRVAAGLWQRFRARRSIGESIALWYHPQYVPQGHFGSARVPNLDLARGERILRQLANERLIDVGDVSPSPTASFAQLLRVHSGSYLESMARPARLAEVFALEASEVDVDEIWTAQRRAVGGTTAAAHWASRHRNVVAFNLGGGFHHAHPEAGAGFCVVNDIAVAIADLRATGDSRPIAIVDLDFHQGDGNLVCFADDESVLTYSLHGSVWSHSEAVANFGMALPDDVDDDTYLEILEDTLPTELDAHGSQLIFYVAGTDVLGGDPLGGFGLSFEGVYARDRAVLGAAAARGLSTVAVLGGGYREDSWLSSLALVRSELCGSPGLGRTIDRQSRLRTRFDRIARTLDPRELASSDNSLELDEKELWGHITGTEQSTKLLDYYSRTGIELALERYGFLEELRRRGLDEVEIAIDTTDPDAQRISLFYTRSGERMVVAELVLARRIIRPPRDRADSFEALSIEWLLLQDPTKSFNLRRPPLPGQTHPSLGMLRETMELLRQVCLRLELDGIVVHPAHFHTAYHGAGFLKFLDPKLQGRFDAVRAAVADLDLATASSHIGAGELVDGDGSPLVWFPEDYVHPVSERLVSYFESHDYERERQLASSERFYLRTSQE